MIAFWIKKFVAFWLMPMNVAMVLIGLSLFLSRKGRPSAWAKRCLWCAFALLLLIGNKTVSRLLIQPLERRYEAVREVHDAAALPDSLKAARYIIVLGGGHAAEPTFPAHLQLSNSALARISEGVRLARLLPSTKLILFGSGATAETTHAKTLMRTARDIGGIAPERCLLSEFVRDTEDEVRQAKNIAGGHPVALVTSACHMPRAVRLASAAGLDVFPCPTDFLGKTSGNFSWNDLGWDSESITRSTFAIREYIGAAWVLIKP